MRIFLTFALISILGFSEPAQAGIWDACLRLVDSVKGFFDTREQEVSDQRKFEIFRENIDTYTPDQILTLTKQVRSKEIRDRILRYYMRAKTESLGFDDLVRLADKIKDGDIADVILQYYAQQHGHSFSVEQAIRLADALRSQDSVDRFFGEFVQQNAVRLSPADILSLADRTIHPRASAVAEGHFIIDDSRGRMSADGLHNVLTTYMGKGDLEFDGFLQFAKAERTTEYKDHLCNDYVWRAVKQPSISEMVEMAEVVSPEAIPKIFETYFTQLHNAGLRDGDIYQLISTVPQRWLRDVLLDVMKEIKWRWQ